MDASSFKDTDGLIFCTGTLMNKDRPLALFCINECDTGTIAPLELDGNYYPWEMRKEQTWNNFLRFLDARLTPPTREGICNELREHGFDSYSYAAILLASNGRDCSDPYWVRFEDGPQTWKEVWEAIGVYYKT